MKKMLKFGIWIVGFIHMMQVEAVTHQFKIDCRYPQAGHHTVWFCYQVYLCDITNWTTCGTNVTDDTCFPKDEYIRVIRAYGCSSDGTASVNNMKVTQDTNIKSTPNTAVITTQEHLTTNSTYSTSTLFKNKSASSYDFNTTEQELLKTNGLTTQPSVTDKDETLSVHRTTTTEVRFKTDTFTEGPSPAAGYKTTAEEIITLEATSNHVNSVTEENTSTTDVQQQSVSGIIYEAVPTTLVGGMILGSLLTVAVFMFSSKVQRFVIQRHKIYSTPHETNISLSVASEINMNNIYSEVNSNYTSPAATCERQAGRMDNARQTKRKDSVASADSNLYEILSESTFIRVNETNYSSDDEDTTEGVKNVYFVLEKNDRKSGTLKRKKWQQSEIQESTMPDNEYFVLQKVERMMQDEATYILEDTTAVPDHENFLLENSDGRTKSVSCKNEATNPSEVRKEYVLRKCKRSRKIKPPPLCKYNDSIQETNAYAGETEGMTLRETVENTINTTDCSILHDRGFNKDVECSNDTFNSVTESTYINVDNNEHGIADSIPVVNPHYENLVFGDGRREYTRLDIPQANPKVDEYGYLVLGNMDSDDGQQTSK